MSSVKKVERMKKIAIIMYCFLSSTYTLPGELQPTLQEQSVAIDDEAEQFDAILQLIEQDEEPCPVPVFEKPSDAELWFRKIGIWIFLKGLGAKDWCKDSYVTVKKYMQNLCTNL